MSKEVGEEEICCILRVCCGGHGERKAKAALSAKMQREQQIDPATADKLGAWIIDTFDLAMPGSLKLLVSTTAAMAREYPYTE